MSSVRLGRLLRFEYGDVLVQHGTRPRVGWILRVAQTNRRCEPSQAGGALAFSNHGVLLSRGYIYKLEQAELTSSSSIILRSLAIASTRNPQPVSTSFATPHQSVTMQFTTLALALLAAVSTTLAATVTVSYDETYDNSDGQLTTVACSDGPNGLITKGFSTFGSLPHFPNIGGAAAVAGWNSAQCGSCWQLTYNGKSINVLAIDHTDSGFNVALGALNTLTDNQGVFLGRVNATAKQVAASACGL
ncbi:Cerato-platanin-domain-containing protein [Dichomitus squalens]|uniref:Cerato-platanin-domain-containing protein n=1 Tax=Dichomitus squalens TaxID=114155 RepID=A0A4Q9Q1Y7_9APHY|nr:Cerato-platanin-domain-containing protein [Dichomitus squalens]TBU61233.1 Cerato-platanin-domain-containing protein [Dichomitus squalens]